MHLKSMIFSDSQLESHFIALFLYFYFLGFHFYTLNLEKSVLAVLKGLNIEESTAARR